MDPNTKFASSAARASGAMAALLLILAANAPAQAHPLRRSSRPVHVGTTMRAKATYYAARLNGRRTASGERFNPRNRTAATNLLPLKTSAAVTNVKNGKTTDVRVTDRRPRRHRGRIDLSKAAAEDIGLTRRQGTAPVKIQVTKMPETPAR